MVDGKGENWEDGRRINADILVELCGGNRIDALNRCRLYSGITINVSVKTLEGFLCDELIEAGYSNNRIAKMLDLKLQRVKRRRKRLYEKEKRKNTRDN